MPFEFGDSTNPALIPFSYAALYSSDCDYPCPPGADRWDTAHTRWITFHGEPRASTIDFEPGTRDYQQPGIISDWLRARESRDIERPAWIYCDLSNAALAASDAEGHLFYWWIATLDNTRRSRSELSALLIDWGVPFSIAHPTLIAANQWRDAGRYDESICFGNW